MEFELRSLRSSAQVACMRASFPGGSWAKAREPNLRTCRSNHCRSKKNGSEV